MEQIPSENTLLTQLQEDIRKTKKKKVLLFAGHFPLVYEDSGAIEAIHRWGEFSTYTLELGAKLGAYARSLGKEVEFVFFVDDHFYEDPAFRGEIGWRSIKSSRQRVYKLRSGDSAVLPKTYANILSVHDFSEAHVLRHNHRKYGREDCLYFSEKILRASSRDIENACAREYTEFLEDPQYVNKESTYFVSFIPGKCTKNICSGVLDITKDLETSHIFMATDLEAHEVMNTATKLTREDLYKEGVFYRKD